MMIKSSIKTEYVNWVETFKLNINPLYSEEKEVRLFKNTPIKIKNIYNDRDEIIEISAQIKNKIFKA